MSRVTQHTSCRTYPPCENVYTILPREGLRRSADRDGNIAITLNSGPGGLVLPRRCDSHLLLRWSGASYTRPVTPQCMYRGKRPSAALSLRLYILNSLYRIDSFFCDSLALFCFVVSVPSTTITFSLTGARHHVNDRRRRTSRSTRERVLG